MLVTKIMTDVFTHVFKTRPGIYIPVLVVDEYTLGCIINDLDLFTPSNVELHQKRLQNGTYGTCAFIDVERWHDENAESIKMRSKLLQGDEVKIMTGIHNTYFICKKKHEPVMDCENTNDNIPPSYVDFNHIAISPKNVKGVNRTPSPQWQCPECVEGLENQLGHTCVQRMMEEQ